MKRRQFMTSLAGFGAGAAAGLAACNQPQSTGDGPAVVTGQNVRWRLASSFPRSLDTLFGGAETLSERVSAMTGGAFDIRVYPAGELVPGLQVMDAVQQGTVQVGQTASYYYTGKNPALAFDTCVPFGLTARQQSAWLAEGGGLDLVNGLFSDFGIRSFPSGNTGVQMGGWFNREVNSLSELQGLKMRIPGAGGDVMNMLGVSVQVIAGGEIYPALERGAIDATEWVGPYDDEKLGFHKVVKNYYYPGWWEPGPSLSVYVNDKAWSELPVAYQEIFRVACADAGAVMQQRYDARNPAALQSILASGVVMRPFADDIMKGAQEAAQQYLEDNAAQDPGYRKIFEAFSKARNEQRSWFGLAERAYHSFVSR